MVAINSSAKDLCLSTFELDVAPIYRHFARKENLLYYQKRS